MSEETLVLPTAHPDAAVLAAFARGKLSSTELAAVAEHVAACDECCAAFRNVPDDTLVSLARQAGETPSDQASIPAAALSPVDGAPPALVRTLRPEVPAELAAVIAKLMAKDPAERFQTPAEVVAALAPFAKGTPTVATQTPPPAPAVAESAFDTEPDTPEVHDGSRPRKARKAKWLVVAGIALFGLLAGVFIREVLKNRGGADTAGTPARSNPTPPGTTPDKAGPLKVLSVVPPTELWMADYKPVRERLEANGVTVVRASTWPGFAETTWVGNTPSEKVPIDVVLAPDMDLSAYAAVVFCGKDSFEYIGVRRGAPAAKAVIGRMQKDGKVVAAICYGQRSSPPTGIWRGRRPPSSPRSATSSRTPGRTGSSTRRCTRTGSWSPRPTGITRTSSPTPCSRPSAGSNEAGRRPRCGRARRVIT